MATMTQASLEQKSRDELDSIARAMGGKPSSRARKAEIVELIMELVGPEAAVSDTDEDDSKAAAADNGALAKGAQAGSAAVADADGDDSSDADSADAAAGSRGSDRGSGRSSKSGSIRSRSSGRDDGDDDDDDDDMASGKRRGKARSFSYSSEDAGHPSAGLDDDDDSDDSRSGDSNRRGRNRSRSRNQGGGSGGQSSSKTPVDTEGYLDLREEGYGFLRVKGYLATKSDVYVSVKQVKQFGLRKGDLVTGAARPSGQNEKNPALLRIDAINGKDPKEAAQRRKFEDLTPLFPDVQLRMERDDEPQNMTTRIVDLLSPIGKGQRGMIVSPPKAGKTTIMKEIARSIELNNPEVILLVLLVDERPEEVTDMRRWLKRPSSEVIASTFDRPANEHTYIAELAMERAKRLVESGHDVVIVLDGITRLARAYNQALPGTGRLMSGGMDAGSLYPPKRFFGAARNVEEGGSLTILGTALVETGSKMDEVIFEEFKGTGNMELRLDRRSAERRIYPAIDVDSSSTRHEELLFERDQLQQVWKLRRVLSGLASENEGNGAAGLELLIDRLRQFPSNKDFLSEVTQGQMRT